MDLLNFKDEVFDYRYIRVVRASIHRTGGSFSAFSPHRIVHSIYLDTELSKSRVFLNSDRMRSYALKHRFASSQRGGGENDYEGDRLILVAANETYGANQILVDIWTSALS
jgi:hypothetical protein